jgi:hypothetical protein
MTTESTVNRLTDMIKSLTSSLEKHLEEETTESKFIQDNFDEFPHQVFDLKPNGSGRCTKLLVRNLAYSDSVRVQELSVDTGNMRVQISVVNEKNLKLSEQVDNLKSNLLNLYRTLPMSTKEVFSNLKFAFYALGIAIYMKEKGFDITKVDEEKGLCEVKTPEGYGEFGMDDLFYDLMVNDLKRASESETMADSEPVHVSEEAQPHTEESRIIRYVMDPAHNKWRHNKVEVQDIEASVDMKVRVFILADHLDAEAKRTGLNFHYEGIWLYLPEDSRSTTTHLVHFVEFDGIDECELKQHLRKQLGLK